MRSKTSKFDLFTKITAYVLIAVFIVRIFCYESVIRGYIGLDSSPLSKGVTIISLIAIWMQYASVMAIMMGEFFKIKTVDRVIKFITPISLILNAIFLKDIVLLLSGKSRVSVLLIMYIIELALCLILVITKWIKNSEIKINYKQVFLFVGCYGLMLIPSLPTYFVQFMFGYGNPIYNIVDLTFAHRVMLYLSVIIPFLIYFGLRNRREEVVRFSLIYLSLAALVTFVAYYDYTDIAKPWAWPFHLCNTAMFIIPLCLIFKFKKLFYFTYFINVFGALLAMLMPNYNEFTNMFSDRIFQFWLNHWLAFFMPILIVALKLFPRPKVKQFGWSMIWFLCYFVIALTLNVVFTEFGHDVDYFFLNSDFIADKLGKWAENMFNVTVSFTINGRNFEFHPIYQTAFFVVYVLLGLGVWFVYAEMYRIADSHHELSLRLKAIKQYEYANASALDSKRKEELMNQNLEAKFELQHFSKKYATSKVYAVEDANLEVHAGEIFGFLGPNGAGKSTIIKSTVGIQPITEGHIKICGLDVKADPVACKYNIGYVPDHYALYEKLTGREYINYIADIYEVSEEDRNERIEKYIKLFELQNSIDSKIKTYSHGMKQKITIMAALVHEPKVWILDEPLTGLDPNSIYQVKECMRQHAAKGNIVFFSSHIIDIVEKLCGRIAIIKKGKIQCVKTVEEIEQSGLSLEEFYLKTIEDKEEEK